MKIHQLSIDEALKSVHAKPTGLTSPEAERRQREFGSNIVEKPSRPSLISTLRRNFGNFFAVVLWLSAGLAFVAEWNDPGQGMAKVGFAVVAVILVSGVFSFWQERRVEKTLAALQQLLPRKITVLRDEVPMELPVEKLVPGDVILIEQGDRVPADCRLIESYSLRVNTSTITGESDPKERNTDVCQEEELIHGSNILLASTSLVSGEGRAVVFATGINTEFGKIAHLSQSGAGEITPLRRELAHLSRIIVFLAIGIGVIFFATGILMGIPLWQDVLFAIGIFVAMVPEGLMPTLTLALVLAAQRMAKRNVLIRHLPSVETLGSTTVICTDKTGTLTENRMRIQELMLGLDVMALKQLEDNPNLAASHKEFFQTVQRCHSLVDPSRQVGGDLIGDPMDVALAEMARRYLPDSSEPQRCGELPFDSKRMRQSVTVETPEGVVLYCKGALETILPLCTDILTNAGRASLDQKTQASILLAQEGMAKKGLRVLAMASKSLPTASCLPEDLPDRENGLTFQGLAGLEDPPRLEVPDAIRRCHEAGIKVIMVTGDHPSTATAIAREIGLVHSANPRIITGEELRMLSSTQLISALDASEIIFARLAAVQKMRIVNALKEKGHSVQLGGARGYLLLQIVAGRLERPGGGVHGFLQAQGPQKKSPQPQSRQEPYSGGQANDQPRPGRRSETARWRAVQPPRAARQGHVQPNRVPPERAQVAEHRSALFPLAVLAQNGQADVRGREQPGLLEEALGVDDERGLAPIVPRAARRLGSGKNRRPTDDPQAALHQMDRTGDHGVVARQRFAQGRELLPGQVRQPQAEHALIAGQGKDVIDDVVLGQFHGHYSRPGLHDDLGQGREFFRRKVRTAGYVGRQAAQKSQPGVESRLQIGLDHADPAQDRRALARGEAGVLGLKEHEARRSDHGGA